MAAPLAVRLPFAKEFAPERRGLGPVQCRSLAIFPAPSDDAATARNGLDRLPDTRRSGAARPGPREHDSIRAGGVHLPHRGPPTGPPTNEAPASQRFVSWSVSRPAPISRAPRRFPARTRTSGMQMTSRFLNVRFSRRPSGGRLPRGRQPWGRQGWPQRPLCRRALRIDVFRDAQRHAERRRLWPTRPRAVLRARRQSGRSRPMALRSGRRHNGRESKGGAPHPHPRYPQLLFDAPRPLQ